MRISDWSSDVCSSDLRIARQGRGAGRRAWRGGGRGELQRAPAAARAQAGVGQDARRVSRLRAALRHTVRRRRGSARPSLGRAPPSARRDRRAADRKSVVEGKRVSVRVDLGGRRIIKKKKHKRIKKKE